MKRLTAVLVIGVVLLWSTGAFAQYAALEDSPWAGPWVGVGGLVISGDDGSGNSNDAFVGTVNIAGLTDYLAWQAFYGMDGEEATVWGGSVDYIVASNFDECFTCPDMGVWWFGVGGTLMDATDLYYDENDANAALSETYYGPNLGFGYAWGDWMLNLYGHYLMADEDSIAFQGMVMYNFGR